MKQTIYKITTKDKYYINPIADGVLDWKCDSSCMTDSDEGLENWQNRLYELHGHHCARITQSIRWVGSEARTSPTFDGLTNLEDFLEQLSVQVPDSQKMEALDTSFRATTAR